MTERDLYDAALIEINKLEAPSMLLEDYNYFINKAIQQYINKAYNRYEINQQATDDLGALKVSKTIDINPEILKKEEELKNTSEEESEEIPEEPQEPNYAPPIFPGETKHYYAVLPNNY